MKASGKKTSSSTRKASGRRMKPCKWFLRVLVGRPPGAAAGPLAGLCPTPSEKPRAGKGAGSGPAGPPHHKTMRILCVLSASAVLLLPLSSQAQTRRRIFSKILTGEPYTLECYLPQITNGPNFPSWSPDGKEIAFAMKGSIWRLKLGETTAHELTTDPGYSSQPVWSPDGKWIVYTSDLNEQIHLKLLNLDDGSTRQLTSGNSINVEPEWSPDGTRLAYVSTWPNGNYNIYILPLSSGVS